ncbi:Maf-like protein [Toxocara canis]|uniref:Maf-like protein n=2 Tax=Toxocara canis TaxID=6265 RepID=A0A0B2VC85_TOXCA|nr:Maf-like protein [Toxocara canis]VDM45579.1 unnamed protein product [Toxocara canis]
MHLSGIEPIVKISDYAEDLSKEMPVADFVEQTAKNKALAVASKLTEDEYDVILGCDTVIADNGEIIGKPVDADDAIRTLRRLSNRTHEVFSGVALIDANKCELFHERTLVKFGAIPNDVIERYVSCGEPMGLAGSYGIQAGGAMFVESIEGCFYNVVGLPLHQLAKRLWQRASQPHQL